MRHYRYLPLMVAAVLFIGFHINGLVGCTSTGDPDWPAIERELDLTATDLETLAQTAQALQNASDAIRQAHAVVTSGGPPGDAWGLVDASLDVLAALAEKEADTDLALGVATARIVLGRVKAYLPERVEPE